MSPAALASLRRQFRSWQEITGRLQDVQRTYRKIIEEAVK